MANSKENVLVLRHILFIDDRYDDYTRTEVQQLKKHFCGIVIVDSVSGFFAAIAHHSLTKETAVFVSGNIQQLVVNSESARLSEQHVYIVRELSENYENCQWGVKSIVEIPIHILEIGVYIQQAFSDDRDYFDCITSEHQFQALTESNKPGTAFRKGIYLTRVTPQEGDPDILNFHLLRCSSNLHGPSDNFRATDEQVVGRVNEMAASFFATPTDMNHVLAQVYENRYVTSDNGHVKEGKASIKSHSDKTKDMDPHGLIAFVTFYKREDHVKKNATEAIYTRLRFRRKHSEKKDVVNVVLHPNSVLLISLSTNRLWTHEIVPSSLSINQTPTRLGYVVRCSQTPAFFKDGQTFMVVKGKDGAGTMQHIPLVPADNESVQKVKELYFQENTTTNLIQYPPTYFSMNQGDYCQPLL
eukprot:Phypoly_transcript_09242.p1 GENE.Phypoly_transcript_09242~~Phypoly_transcript_09242.p1  ORF type:complete len:463 (+),score=28.04 Phypoly_transcript_09242:148-1389(+)